MESSKMIVIKSVGRVETSRGRVYAPIKKPYRESVSMILKMVTKGVDVWEVLPNKEEVQLTTTNYDKNNMLPVPSVDEAPPSAKDMETSNTPLDHAAAEETKEVHDEFSCDTSCLDNPMVDEQADRLMEMVQDMADQTESVESTYSDDEEIGRGNTVPIYIEASNNVEATNNVGKTHGKNKNKNKNRHNRPVVEATIPEEVQ